MPTTIYFTAVIAATNLKHTIAVPDNYSMRDLRAMLSAASNVALEALQLSRHDKVLPYRHRETVTSAGIRGGSQILVSSKNGPVSKSMRDKVNEDNSSWFAQIRRRI